MNSINDREADVLIGGIDDDQRVKKLLWISRTYMQDDMTWCVAKARPRDLWSNIFQIYTIELWGAIAATTIIVAFTIKQFLRTEKIFEDYVWTFLLAIAAIIGKSITYEPSRVSIRVMMCFLFMYGLEISTSFSTFLISTLTQPRLKHQFDNLPDALRAGFKFASGNVAYEHYLRNDSVWNM